MNTPPTIECQLSASGRQVSFGCPHCKTRRGKPVMHFHGSACIGFRHAHCADPKSPLRATGYVLVLREAAT